MSTVFLFGAGASKAEGAPLTSELLYEALRQPHMDKNLVEVVVKFLKDFFGIADLRCVSCASQLPSFEELLTIVDLAILKHEAFSREWNEASLEKLHDALVYNMSKILKEKLQSQLETAPKYHSDFIQTIYRNRMDDNPSDYSFLSLNYDLLLDNALIALFPRLDLDYSIDFRNYVSGPRDWEKPHAEHSVKLLKLHGSLNWMFCPVCNSVRLTPKEKIADRIITEEIPCELDHAIQRPLLIPPTWLKVYDNAYLMQIWLNAERILRSAEKVFFVGCSLPESDIHVRYLLKKSLYRAGEKPKITVVTRPENSEGSKLHLRYKRLFGEVDWHSIGFEVFSKDAEKYLVH